MCSRWLRVMPDDMIAVRRLWSVWPGNSLVAAKEPAPTLRQQPVDRTVCGGGTDHPSPTETGFSHGRSFSSSSRRQISFSLLVFTQSVCGGSSGERGGGEKGKVRERYPSKLLLVPCVMAATAAAQCRAEKNFRDEEGDGDGWLVGSSATLSAAVRRLSAEYESCKCRQRDM